MNYHFAAHFKKWTSVPCRAGHFRYFLAFSILKNDFLPFFQVNNYLCTSPIKKKPTPSQINLIKNAKNHFLLLKKFPKSAPSSLTCR